MFITNKTGLFRVVKQLNNETVDLCLWHVTHFMFLCIILKLWFYSFLSFWYLWYDKVNTKRCSIWNAVQFSCFRFINKMFYFHLLKNYFCQTNSHLKEPFLKTMLRRLKRFTSKHEGFTDMFQVFFVLLKPNKLK